VEIPPQFKQHAVVFSEEAAKCFPPSHSEDHVINLHEDAPSMINCKMYKLTLDERDTMATFLQEQQKKGYIEHLNSPWFSPFFYIKKKSGQRWPVYNYWEVNWWTIPDVYPLPQIDIIFDQMKDAKLMSKFDIRDGYYNIWIHLDSQWITAVKTKEGLFEAKVISFGLSNALATFQHMIDWIFINLKQKYPKYIHWYMNDFIIATPDNQKLHNQITKEYLEIMEKESLFLKSEKCQFTQRTIEFLGYIIDQGTIWVDPSKSHGLENWNREHQNV
jgi:Reverse transcriptase (RNA-dependent DNA polymerase)